MLRTRLMLVELVRAVSEMLIHLILFDYDPGNIHLDAQVHGFAGENSLLYDAAVEMGWESRCLDGVAWARSNPSMSKTTVFLPEEVTCHKNG